ncbi:MAG: putative metal-binding motif-containing protein [Flavobacteriales bacterium]|nr:putative metal-binding motif-containing protein [Flavobacteriales bacterium]
MRFLTLFVTALLCSALTAQVPQAFDFQAVARDASGNVLSTQSVGVRLTVRSGAATGPIAYRETHAVVTSSFGLFSVAVGQGNTVQGEFATVAWGSAPHYLQVELDGSGGSTYVDMGTTQLLSVPYALHAGSVDCPTVSLLGDTLKQTNGCFVIIPGLSAANGGCLDTDNDGFYNNAACPPLDCNDADAQVNPGAAELCGNGTDDDCDGTPDNNTDPQTFVLFYADSDGDGYGDAAISNSACAQPVGHVANDDDCDDSDPNIFPGQNCSVLCTAAEAAWVSANFADYREALMNAFSNCLFGNDPTACIQNSLAGAGFPLSAECNSCGITWANCVRTNCLIPCVQGQAACNACMNTAGCNAGLMQCFGLTDADSDGWPAGSDCDDANADIYPGAQEVCDGLDNDCDGIVDDQLNLFADQDEDGFGDPNAPVPCSGVGVSNSGDCDDSEPLTNPSATEMCGDGIDNNCDGQVDEDCGPLELCDGLDNDGNGQIDEGLGLGQACGCGGVVICDGNGGTTCSQPGLPETCNGIDDDCDGLIDEGGVCGCAPAGTPCSDGNACTVNDIEDGACNCISGAAAVCDDGNPCTFDTCNPLTGCVFIAAPAGTACDDGNPNTINDACDGTGVCVGTPVANEVCDGLDNDGDGLTDAADPGLVLVLCENQIGVCNGVQKTSNLCVTGTWLTCATSDYTSGSAAYEPNEVTCDTQDNDCDGQVDEDNVCDPCSGPNVCNISGQCFTSGQANPVAYCQVCNPLQSTTSWSFRPFGTVCIQGTDCTFSSICDGLGQCGPLLNRPAGTACDDGNPNTINDVCNGAGFCSGTAMANEVCDGVDNDGDGLTDAADPGLMLVLCENQIGVCNGVQKTSNLCVGGAWVTCATSEYASSSAAYETSEVTCDTQDNDCDGIADEDGACSPPAAPTITGSTPLSPSNNNTPTLVGTSDEATIVRFYASNNCQGAPVAVSDPVSGGFFGQPVPVGLNTITVITAKATSVGGVVSTCSSSFTYMHIP